MFSNQNTPLGNQNSFSNQNTNPNQASPFGNTFQKIGATNTSIFQSPMSNPVMTQQSTPSFMQNTFVPQTTAPSIFGSQNTLGTQSTFGSTFGSNNNNNNTFGNQNQQSAFAARPSTSMFGSTNNAFSGFGQPAQSTSTFSSLPKPETNKAIPLGPGPSTFGNNTQNSFGTNTFNSVSQPTNNAFQSNTFSNQQSTQPFGGFSTVSNPQQTNNTFSGFGTQSTSQASNFGFPSSGFGVQPPQSTSSTSMFGVPQSSTQTSIFGNSSNSFGSKPFGVTTTATTSWPSSQNTFSSFGSTATTANNAPSFSFSSLTTQPSQSTFPSFGQSTLTTSQPQSNIFGQPQTNTFGSNAAPTSSFGQTSNSFNSFAQPTQPQASTSIFGSQPTSQPTNTFGQSSNAPFRLNIPASQPTTSNMFSTNTFNNNPGTQNSFLSSSSQPLFGANPTTTASSFSFGSTNMQQPPSSVLGGGLSTAPFNPTSQPSFPTINLTSFSSSSAPPSTVQPVSQTVVFPGSANLSSVINSEPDKSVDLFGYRASASRFGPVEYFSSTYNNPPDIQNVTDISLNASGTVNPQDIESFSYNAYEHDIKLGNTVNANNDFELREAPMDTITRLRFNQQQSDLLACSSWDGSVSVWKIDDLFNRTGSARVSIPGCAFDIDWLQGGNLIMAGSSGILYHFDVTVQNFSEFARHSGPIKCVRVSPDYNNLIVSGSYDGYVKVWDARSKVCVSTIPAGGKVFGLDACKNGFSFINSEREVLVYRFNEYSRPQIKRKIESSPFPLRCIAMSTFNCRKDGGFVASIGTTGGKVSVVAQSNNAKDFTFKVHRMNQVNRNDALNIFPVHDIQFHPRSYVLALAGGDGSISFWDIQKHTSVHMLNRSSMPVTSLSFNSDGRFLAYAVGYDWSRGIRGYKYRTMKPAIFIRRCDQELKYQSPNQVHNY